MKQIKTILKDRFLVILIVVISLVLSTIETIFKIPMLIGSWHIVFYILLLLPLLYLIATKKIVNRYTKWFIPLLLVMIADMFVYSNSMVQLFLPIVFYISLFLLYLSSMQKSEDVYKIFLPSFIKPTNSFKLIKEEVSFSSFTQDKTIYKRVALALALTLPFLLLFAMLFSSADYQFREIMLALDRLIYKISIPSNFEYIFFYFMLFLSLFFYSLTNTKEHFTKESSRGVDFLIVGIFLGSINLLFAVFLSQQLPFLIRGITPKDINIATYAREGFFQLMLVMFIVVAIFIFITKRYKIDKRVKLLLMALLAQSITLGIVSLKKMYLYQELKGATVLRYYVEWFDYFLILSLVLGIAFLVGKYSFSKLLNIITTIGAIAFVVVVSLNIDKMVAEYNIVKFQNSPKLLDKNYLKNLSIDALPVIKKYKIELNSSDVPWYVDRFGRRDCNNFGSYHYGYCTTLKKYGENNGKHM